MQTGQYAHLAQLEEEAATAILGLAHCRWPCCHRVLGHRHLKDKYSRHETPRTVLCKTEKHSNDDHDEVPPCTESLNVMKDAFPSLFHESKSRATAESHLTKLLSSLLSILLFYMNSSYTESNSHERANVLQLYTKTNRWTCSSLWYVCHLKKEHTTVKLQMS